MIDFHHPEIAHCSIFFFGNFFFEKGNDQESLSTEAIKYYLYELKDVMDITKSDFKSTEALNAYHKFIFEDLHKEFPFEFIDENVVINH